MITTATPRIGFIGAGRTATVLALALDGAGYEVVAIASRSLDSARTLASRLSHAVAVELQGVVGAANLVFIAAPDDAIRSVCEGLAWREGVAVVHLSGVETRDVLASAAAQGAQTGSLHPLQTFASTDGAPKSLAGVYFAIEAEGELEATLCGIVTALGGEAIVLRPEDRALYHASAVLASNYVVTLMKLASDLWLRLGFERTTGVKALLPLMQGAIDNLRDAGLPGALTGPVARGDVESVRRHVDALATAAPELLDVYIDLALETIPVALAKGGLSEAAAAELRAILVKETAKAAEGVGTKR